MTNGFTDSKGVLHADDVSLHDLAAEYGTPAYVYSASKMRDSVGRMTAALKKALPADRQPLIAYACKVNSNLSVIKLMAGLGLGADIVSGGELIRSVKGGVPPGKIVFSGVGKTDDEIMAALDHGILQMNVESREELEHIAALAARAGKKAAVSLRFNPDVDAHTHANLTTGKTESKFGMGRAVIDAVYGWAAKHPHLHLRGLSMHIGSQIVTLEPYRQAFEKLADLARHIQSQNLPLESLDLGGGLGVRYKDEVPPDLDIYAGLIRDIIAPLGTQIILEPGRLFTGEAGILLAKVLYVKEGENRRFLVLDAGMTDLIRPALYGAYHPVLPLKARPGPLSKYDVVGPICESSDVFGKDRELPEMKAGDLVAIMVAGASGFVMASNYNTKPLPPEIMVDGKRHALIRQRQTIQDILEKETIPGWLT